jgi:hypothetical protein
MSGLPVDSWNERRTGFMEFLLLAGVFAAWIVLNLWVLPRLGVPT